MKLEWSIESIENGYIVDKEMFFEELEDAEKYIRKTINRECKLEFS